MKRLCLAAAIILASSGAYAQGTFDFMDPCKGAEGEFADGVQAARFAVCAAYDPLISGLPYWLGSGEPSSDVSEGG